MLKFLKNILTSSAKNTGDITIQNETFKEAEINCSTQEITIVKKESLGKDHAISIMVQDISDLQINKNILSFTAREKKYKINSTGSVEIYNKISPLLVDKCYFKSEKLQYFIYDPDKKTFDPVAKKISLQLYEKERFYLRIEDVNLVIHFEEISTATQYYSDQVNSSFVWSVYANGLFYTFCIKFDEKLDFLEFVSKYVEYSYKSVNKESGEYKFFNTMATFTNTTPSDAKIDEEDDWDEYEDSKPKDNAFSNNKNFNEHLVMGNNQVFVTRGHSLGVFDLENGDLDFRTQILNAVDDPQKIKSSHGDTNLIVLEKNDREHLGLLDLEKGEVVERWKMKDSVNDYFDSVKYDNSGTLLGVSDYALFRIDPRVKDKVVERNEYKTKNDFSCGIATEKGDVAVASRKGDLRLYNKIGVRAKSLLPGFGDNILGIDTSKDGSIIVCTCKSYILVFSVNSDYSKNVKDKSPPKRLQLKPQHLGCIKDEISFTPAKFDSNDKFIITSTGRFVVKWKVEDVLEGNIYSYSLKALNEKIVDENFVMNGDDIVVALQNDVRKMSEKDLRKPSY